MQKRKNGGQIKGVQDARNGYKSQKGLHKKDASARDYHGHRSEKDKGSVSE
jgi:hypothetical protein